MSNNRRKPSLQRLIPAAILACAVLSGAMVTAQSVTIESASGVGQGFMLNHEGVCYVVLPRHVAAGKRQVRAISAAPVESGMVLVEAPFWEGLDLAIGVLRGALEGRCTATLDMFASQARPETGMPSELIRLRPSGEVERLPMQIAESGYLVLLAAMTRPGDEIYEGTSGAFLFADGKPLGMVIEAPSLTVGRFIRIEEIYQNVARWLLNRGGAFVAPEATVASSGVTIPVRLASAAAPISPEFGAEAMLGAGAYIFQPSSRNTLAFQVEGDGSVPLSRVVMRTDPGAGHSLPRQVGIFVSSRREGGLDRFLRVGEMAPDGVLDVAVAPTNMRWVYLIVESGWGEGPIRIDTVEFR